MNKNANDIDYNFSDIDDATLEELAALILGIGKSNSRIQPIYVTPKIREIVEEEEEEVTPVIIKKIVAPKITPKPDEDEFEFTGDGEYSFNGRQVEKPVRVFKPVELVPQEATFITRKEEGGKSLKLDVNENPENVNVFEQVKNIKPETVVEAESKPQAKFALKQTKAVADKAGPTSEPAKDSHAYNKFVKRETKQSKGAKRSAKRPVKKNDFEVKTPATPKEQAKADVDEIVKTAEKKGTVDKE